MSTLHIPPDGKLRAITIKEPWATLVAMGHKPIENKMMPFPKNLPLPCTLAIHASTNGDTIGDDWATALSDEHIFKSFDNPNWELHKPGKEWIYGGVIVGLIDVIACDCIADYCDGSEESEAKIIELIDAHPWADGVQKPTARRSDWANGPYCLILANPRRFATGVVTRGQLGYWSVPSDKMKLVNDAMKNILLNSNDMPTLPTGGVPRMLGKKGKVTA